MTVHDRKTSIEELVINLFDVEVMLLCRLFEEFSTLGYFHEFSSFADADGTR